MSWENTVENIILQKLAWKEELGKERCCSEGTVKSSRSTVSGRAYKQIHHWLFSCGWQVKLDWKKTILAHSAWHVGLKIAWRGRLGRLYRSGVPDGDRAVWVDQQLGEGGKNGRSTLGASGGRKRWMPPILSVLQVRGVFMSERHNNPNRLHTNPNFTVVQDSINNMYGAIVI